MELFHNIRTLVKRQIDNLEKEMNCYKPWLSSDNKCLENYDKLDSQITNLLCELDILERVSTKYKQEIVDGNI